MAFPVPRWRLLAAKNTAAMVLRIPGLLMLLVVSAFLAPQMSLAALVATLVGLLLSAAVDNYLSILSPLPAPESGRPAVGGAGRGLSSSPSPASCSGVALVLASPFVFLTWLPRLLGAPWLWLLTLPLALAGALAVYAMLVAGAERVLERREGDLLESILVTESP
jgi:hypothetical protein